MAASPKGDSIGAVAHIDERIVGFLNPRKQRAGQEQQLLLLCEAVGIDLVDRQNAKIDHFIRQRPGIVGSLVTSPGAAS